MGVYNAFIVNIFCLGLGIADGIDSIYKFFKRYLFIFKKHFSAFDPAHIQNVIDKRQKEAGRYSNFS